MNTSGAASGFPTVTDIKETSRIHKNPIPAQARHHTLKAAPLELPPGRSVCSHPPHLRYGRNPRHASFPFQEKAADSGRKSAAFFLCRGPFLSRHKVTRPGVISGTGFACLRQSQRIMQKSKLFTFATKKICAFCKDPFLLCSRHNVPYQTLKSLFFAGFLLCHYI